MAHTHDSYISAQHPHTGQQAAAEAKLQEFTTDDDFDAFTASLPPAALLVVYFHAPWAEPCKQMSTFLSALATTFPATYPPTVAFASLNAEELPDVSEKYDVTAVPYVVLQRNGAIIEKISGSDAAKVRAAVEKHAGKSGSTGKPSLPPAQTVTKQENTGLNGVSPAANHASSHGAVSEAASGEQTKEELWKRLEGLVKAAPVMLFMKGTPSSPQCGFSRQTVALLRERSIRYGFFNILADDDVRQGLKEFSDWPTFPQLYVDGELVGGLDIVSTSHSNYV
jgi:Grx4 family monothiol glutaredoxin